MAFSDTWYALQTNLSNGTVIPNWTAHSGDIGAPFTVRDISDTFVLVDAPGAQSLQSVPRADFEAVYDRWDDYINASLARHELTPLTRYSKYVISILRWLESQREGRLP